MWRAEQSGATQSFHTDGARGEDPVAGHFLIFREKIIISTQFGSHFARFQTYLNELNH